MADLSVLYGYVTNRKRVPGMLGPFHLSDGWDGMPADSFTMDIET